MNNNNKKGVIFANIVLGSIIIVFFLAIVYMLYKSISLHSPFDLNFGAFLTAGLLLSIVTLYLRDNWKINIAIAIFSTLLAVYCVEIVLIILSQSRFAEPVIDERIRREIVDDLQAKGVDAWPQISSVGFIKSNGLLYDNNRIFPIGGISQKTLVYCYVNGQYRIFKTDEYGFNNPKGLYKTGVIKAALLGDSFTLGYCVRPGEDIAGQLREIGVNSLNFGNSSNGPLIELAGLKEYVEPLKPKVVLWIYFEGNDLVNLKRERKSPLLMSYLENDYSQNLLDRQVEIDAVLIKFANENSPMREKIIKRKKERQDSITRNKKMAKLINARRKKLSNIIMLWSLRSRLGLLNETNQKTDRAQTLTRISNHTQLPLFSEILADAYQRSSNWGGTFYFVYLPSMLRYESNNDNGAFFDRDDVLNIIHKIGIPLIDIHEVFSNHPDPLSFHEVGHYNADGYKIVAKIIADRLRKDGLLSRD